VPTRKIGLLELPGMYHWPRLRCRPQGEHNFTILPFTGYGVGTEIFLPIIALGMLNEPVQETELRPETPLVVGIETTASRRPSGLIGSLCLMEKTRN
jgi:hypothetical protein